MSGNENETFATNESWRKETLATMISLQTQRDLWCARAPTCLLGYVATGKTSYTRAVMEEMLDHVHVVSGASLMPELIMGLPFADQVRGVVQLLAAEFFADLAEAGEGRAGLIIDEFAEAPPSVQAALQEVLTSRRAGSLQLPARTPIVVMGNPPDQSTTGGSASEPIATRIVQIPFLGMPLENYNVFRMEHGAALAAGGQAAWPKPDIVSLPKDWVKMIPEVGRKFAAFRSGPGRRFCRTRPKSNASLGGMVLGRAAPAANNRTWEYAEYLLAAADSLGEIGRPARFTLLAGCIGEGPALEYFKFEKDSGLPTPEDCLYATPDLPREGHMLLALCFSVVAFACETGKLEPWERAWDFLVRVADETGAEDMAARSAPMLFKRQPKGLNKIPDAVMRFKPILVESGLFKRAQGGR